MQTAEWKRKLWGVCYLHLVFCASDEFSSQPQSCPFRPCGEPRSWLLSCHTAQVLPSFGWHPCKEFGISVWIFLSHSFSASASFTHLLCHSFISTSTDLVWSMQWGGTDASDNTHPAFSCEKDQETGAKRLPKCVGNRHRSDPAQALWEASCFLSSPSRHKCGWMTSEKNFSWASKLNYASIKRSWEVFGKKLVTV